ncbi:nuclear matrix constituent protein 1 isoform X1 [Malania oleifera]|uniref:nuclear matrix constituent protein 1 isoform X1 n=1 Tax=Malania oleifera TaxID=397392 RepID=UPI0025ADA6B2|nr:nuclear matrix constituent protein 1 isoform X1 [Malania oleifera]
MFTPQRKVWSSWSLTPRSEAQKNVSGTASNPNSDPIGGDVSLAKCKNVAFAEAATTTIGSKEAEEQGPLVEKVTKLEKELFEYQYNMGLLLIEKKEWTSKYDELGQALAEAKDTLKQEQAAHAIVISDVEKREENLRKALGVEKQCVLDLEKALHEMRSEFAEIKFTADSKLAEANALVASIENKSLEVEAKLHAADAKLAEISRKSSEIERRSQELEARGNALRREHLSFNTEREANETALSEQREDLREWERRVQEGEERLAEGQRILNKREERANENDRVFKQKEKDLQEAQKKIEMANLALKKKEDDISSRLAKLALKEKEAGATKKNLEIKEKELLALEEKLTARERVEMQRLLDEHNAFLDGKKCQFELEIEQKRKSVDEDLKSKFAEVEKREAEIFHREEKVAKRELALEKKLEKFKEKEKDFDSKSKALKEREKSIRVEEKNLDVEKRQMLTDKEDLLSLRAGLEKLRADIEEQQLKIHEEKEHLKLTEEERSEYLHLQSELKKEIENCRLQKELILKEGEDLKQDRQSFERQWEDLDEKRVEIQKELEDINEQKEKLEKLKCSEEERLKDEKRATDDYVQGELEALKLARESFAASMEHEKSVIAEKVRSEQTQMIHDFELQKRDLEIGLQKRQEEMEKHMRDREKLFEDEKNKELNKISFSRDVAQREMEEMKQEGFRLEKEKDEVKANKKHLEEQQLEMRTDIDELVTLSRKLKEQREQFMKERERFIAFVEKQKSCQKCGEVTCEFVLSDLQSLTEMEDAGIIPMPKLADDYLKGGLLGDLAASARQNRETSPGVVGLGSPTSGGTISWLRKCTSKIFKFSPGKKNEQVAIENMTYEAHFSGKQVVIKEASKGLVSTEDEPELSLGIASDSFDVQKIPSDNSIQEVEAGQDPSIDDQSNPNIKRQEVAEDSQHSDSKGGQRKPGRRGRVRVNRTRSVKAVVEDAKAIYGEDMEQKNDSHPNGNTEDSAPLKAEGREESSLVDKGTPRNGQKRSLAHTSQTTVSEHDGDNSEGRSDSVLGGRHKKRRQKGGPSVQNPGGKRYYLRRPRTEETVAIASVSSNPNKERKEDADGGGTQEKIPDLKAARASSGGVVSENGGSTQQVQFETAADVQDDNADTSTELVRHMGVSEEVNGSRGGAADCGDREEYRSESFREDGIGDGDGDETEDDDEEVEHPGEVSIGKKLWTFLTT